MLEKRVLPTVMLVDDVPDNLEVLSEILESSGFYVRPHKDPVEAYSSAILEPPDIFVLDILMPELNGFELATKIKQTEVLKDVPIIFLSALNKPEDIAKGFEVGAVDYIPKPFKASEIIARVSTHVKLKKLREELETSKKNIESIVTLKVKEVTQSQLATIISLAKLAEYRDDDTGAHIERVRNYCRVLAERLSMKQEFMAKVNAEFIENIFYSSSLHDVGKVGIPDSILLKPGKLTKEEFEIMKTHTILGANAMKEVLDFYPQNPFVEMGMNIARWHHERWDGSGYPDGLKAEKIPVCAHIMALADVYDALRSKRPYKEPFSHEKATQIIVASKGSQFAPWLVEAFLSVEEEFMSIARRE